MDHRHTDRLSAVDPSKHQQVHEPAFGWYPHEHQVPERGDTVWLLVDGERGSMGTRVRNVPERIAVTLAEMMVSKRASRAEVHAHRCPLGMTSPDPCDCYPVEVVR